MKPRLSLLSLITLIGLAFSVTSQPLPAADNESAASAEKNGGTVVHLSHYSDDLHAVFMALKIATLLLEKEGGISLFVDLEGARLFDKRVPADLKWGQAPATVNELLESFEEAGGVVRVSPHCAKAAGIEASNLREGCTLLTSEELVNLLSSADKVINY